jgi:hypothetical protein
MVYSDFRVGSGSGLFIAARLEPLSLAIFPLKMGISLQLDTLALESVLTMEEPAQSRVLTVFTFVMEYPFISWQLDILALEPDRATEDLEFQVSPVSIKFLSYNTI